MKNITSKLSLLLFLSAALSISACNQNGGGGINDSQIGTVLGGVGGGIAGNQIGRGEGKTVATIGGTVLGGLVGNSVGSSMDKANANYNDNRYNHSNAQPINNSDDSLFQDALENTRTGQTTSWTNSDGSVTRITPTNTYKSNGQDCRNYTETDSTGYRNSSSVCRQNNGVWN